MHECMYVCTYVLRIIFSQYFPNTLTAQPDVVVFYVSDLLSDTKVRVDWLPPPQPITNITSYQVVYSEYEAVDNIESVTLDGNITNYTIQNLGKYICESLMVKLIICDNIIVPGVPYQVRVAAFSYQQMGLQSDFLIFFSKELSPTKTPENVRFVRSSQTSINVTWTPLNLFEAQGFPIYKVTLTPSSTKVRSKRQSSSNVIVTQNNFALFTNLNSNQEYSLTVGVATNGSDNFTTTEPMKGI